MKISCIVPAWNEEKTVSHVLDTLLAVPEIFEIIVINDGSVDSTGDVINLYKDKCLVLHQPENLGKSAAVTRGIKISKGDLIMMIDADLAGLKESHIKLLIDTYATKPGGMVIASATDYGEVIDKAFAPLSGQRIFPKDRVKVDLKAIKDFSYAIEPFLNGLFKKNEITYIAFEGVGHITKYEKSSVLVSIPRYLSSYGHLLVGLIVVSYSKIQDNLKSFLK